METTGTSLQTTIPPRRTHKVHHRHPPIVISILCLCVSMLLQALPTGGVIMLQYSDCETTLEDGTVQYSACTAEPLHLVRNAAPIVTITPEDRTCGAKREAYCTLGIRQCAYCDAAIPSESHPMEYMYDQTTDSQQPNLTSSWQSVTWTDYPTPLDINISLSFNKTYELSDDVVITFGSSRPQTMVLEKSTNHGATWKPLQYYDRTCKAFPGTGTVVTKQEPDEVVCSRQYSEEIPYSNGEVVFPVVEDRYQLFLGPSLTDYEGLYGALNNTNLAEFLTFTDLRIRLLYPATDGKESLRKPQDLIRYYYAINNLKITGGCFCNLHAKVCETVNGATVCDCKHNTEGANCERCKPLYNNRPWKPGFYLPYPYGTANECEKCECYDHADSCIYNTTLQTPVCIDCQHNTTGYHCEQCLPGHFINISIPHSDPNVCVDCNCEPLGVSQNLMTCAAPNGQCFCKGLVEGRRCDICQDQFYGLLMMDNNPGQCKPCLCSPDGTEFQSNTCEKQEGQCPCKAHITGRDCSRCMDGYYDFPKSRPWTSCRSCECDSGGAVSPVCEKDLGQCTCHAGIRGRTCNQASPNMYAPALDHLEVQPKGGGGCEMATGLSTDKRPFSGRMFARCHGTQALEMNEFTGPVQQANITWPYVPVVRYSMNLSSSMWPSASLEITVLGNSNIDMTWYNNNLNVTLLPTCGDVTGRFYTFTYANLSAGYGLAAFPTGGDTIDLDPRCRYVATLTLGPAGEATGPVDIDALVLMPEVMYSHIYRSAEPATKEEYESCASRLMALSTRTVAIKDFWCESLTFSVGTEVHKGALQCDCDVMGSIFGSECDPLDGQCRCKPGVMGLRCDQCAPGYFNFNASGCQACDCHPLGSSTLVCDYTTGQCPCLPFVAQAGNNNTHGVPADRRCSACQQNYYDFRSGTGCQLCICSVSGSAAAQCDDIGVCHCKETIGGANCDTCLDGYFSFSETGCLPCNCSLAGSLNNVCDHVTGQCQCKQNVQDLKCDACADDSFNLDASNPDGCQKCFCYGHGTSCISAPGFTQRIIHSDGVYECESCMNHNWTDSHPLTDDDNTWLSLHGKTIADVIYVTAPPQCLGNLVTSYGQSMSFDAHTLGGGDLDLTGLRPVLLQGNDKTIYYNAENITLTENDQRLDIKLHQDFWFYNETAQPDYFNMYAILADIQAMHVQRTFGSHVLSLMDLQIISSQPAQEGDPLVRYVEQCTCEPTRNVEGRSCMSCVEGTQRGTVNGSVYETCKPCDCNGRAASVPIQCLPSTGECLNCRNGTVGFNCENCAANVQGVECDTCMDGYWGLGADGCRPCECNTVGASSEVCDKVTGQCTCKDHVVGRACDECEDNYYNLQDNGCQECDGCYSLVFAEVEVLRGLRDNLTLFVDQMKSQDNNTILGPFRDRVDSTLQHMDKLLTFLANAESVEDHVTPEVTRMQGSLRHLQEILDIDVTSATFLTNRTLFHADNLLSHGQKVYEETVVTVTDTHTLLSGPIAAMTADMQALLSGLQTVESSIGQLSTGAMADANRVLLVVKEIEKDTSGAKAAAATALEHVQEANSIHQNTTRRVADLEQKVAMVTDLSDQVTMDADYLHGNATVVRDEVVVALLNSTAMEGVAVDGAALQQRANELFREAEDLRTSAQLAESTMEAQLAESTIEAGEVAVIEDVVEAKKVTAKLSTRTEQLQNEAEQVLGRSRVAHQAATQAVANETRVFDDASDMLDVMQHFTTRAEEVEKQANTSLALVQQVKGLSETSIESSLSFQTQLQVTSSTAQAALDTANSSHQVAAKQVEVYRPVYEESLQIEEVTAPLLNDIQDVANQVHKASQNDIEPARITCQGLESQVAAVEARTKTGLDKAAEAAKEVTAARDAIAAIITDLDNIQELDLTAVEALRQRVRAARADFDSRKLAESIQVLRDSAVQQKEWIERMKKRRDEAARMVRRIRDVQQQLRP